MLKKFLVVGALALGIMGAGTANAVPNLQIYIDGATYNTVTETWEINSSSFKLWVITDGSAVDDVKLTAAFLTGETGNISLTGTTTGSAVFTDPSAASNPTLEFTSADGAIPITGDGSPLPTHGIYGAGTSFTQWGLGNMSGTDAAITDFSGTGTLAATGTGSINAYNVVITGYSLVHFDAFDHIVGSNHTKYVFAPFSHDGEGGGGTTGGGPTGGGPTGGGGGSAPEPMSMLLLGGGLLGILATRNRKN